MNQETQNNSREQILDIIENDINVSGLFLLLHKIEQRVDGSKSIINNNDENYGGHSDTPDTQGASKTHRKPHTRRNSKTKS